MTNVVIVGGPENVTRISLVFVPPPVCGHVALLLIGDVATYCTTRCVPGRVSYLLSVDEATTRVSLRCNDRDNAVRIILQVRAAVTGDNNPCLWYL